MKKLKILIFVFCMALSIPLGYFVLRTYWGLKQEEISKLLYFAVALFDQMEEELASFVLEEETRPVDQYRYYYLPSQQPSSFEKLVPSPLTQPPKRSYILGYRQNDPDGSFQTPLVKSDKAISPERRQLVAPLNEVNKVFNQKRTTVAEGAETKPSKILARRERASFNLRRQVPRPFSRKKSSRASLGQEKSRVEEITPGQAVNLARRGQKELPVQPWQKAETQAEEQVPKAGRPSFPALSLDSQSFRLKLIPCKPFSLMKGRFSSLGVL